MHHPRYQPYTPSSMGSVQHPSGPSRSAVGVASGQQGHEAALANAASLHVGARNSYMFPRSDADPPYEHLHLSQQGNKAADSASEQAYHPMGHLGGWNPNNL